MKGKRSLYPGDIAKTKP